MAEIEIGPLADRLADDELTELAGKLEKLGAPKIPSDDDAAGATVAADVDGSVLTEFLDRLEAYDIACEIYLPMDFEGRVEVGDYRVGSAAVLVEVLEEMKDDLAPEEDEEDDEDDEDDDADELEADSEDEEEEEEDDDYGDINLIDAKIRRLWKVVYDGAQTALQRRLPLHVVGREPPATELEVARLVLARPELQERYSGWLATLHPSAWEEIEAMARTANKALKIDFRPAIERLGLAFILEQAGMDRVIEQVGIDRVIEQVGIDRVIEQVGKKEVIKRIGLDDFLANLSPAERRELKRRLQ